MDKKNEIKVIGMKGTYGRFCVISAETGAVIDDAQGYGYTSVKKAYAGYYYKHRDKSKDAENAEKQAHIKKWLKAHKDFSDMMEDCDFQLARYNRRFTAKVVEEMLTDNNLEIDFTPAELLKVWKNN